jgi:hypothetical protein
MVTGKRLRMIIVLFADVCASSRIERLAGDRTDRHTCQDRLAWRNALLSPAGVQVGCDSAGMHRTGFDPA